MFKSQFKLIIIGYYKLITIPRENKSKKALENFFDNLSDEGRRDFRRMSSDEKDRFLAKLTEKPSWFRRS